MIVLFPTKSKKEGKYCPNFEEYSILDSTLQEKFDTYPMNRNLRFSQELYEGFSHNSTNNF